MSAHVCRHTRCAHRVFIATGGFTQRDAQRANPKKWADEKIAARRAMKSGDRTHKAFRARSTCAGCLTGIASTQHLADGLTPDPAT
jgi:hypothetical protein